MYLPGQFEETRLEVLHGLVRAHPLGTWVALADQELIANNIPFLLDSARGPFGTLCCHVARANPLTARAGAVLTSVISFQGPQSYVTPSWYTSKQVHGKVVPTWNYAVVHAHGQAVFISDREWLRRHVAAITDEHERTRPIPWRASDAPDEFLELMVRGIVGVEIRIERLEGKWKASQNRPADDRRGVVRGLLEAGDAESAAMAALVGEHVAKDRT